MSDTDIRAALHDVTSHLRPRPDVLDDVRRAGRARLVRRRGVLTGGLALAAGATASGAVWLPTAGRRRTGAAGPFDRPTTGDLAGDRGLRRVVLDAWYAYTPVQPSDPTAPPNPANQDPYGAAHLTWAGATPAGPAAFVIQRQRPRGSSELVTGLVTVAGGTPVVQWQGVWLPQDGVSYAHAFLIGAERDVLVVRDAGTPVRYSTVLKRLGDGRIRRTYHPLPFTGGAAVLAVPPQRERATLAMLTGPGGAGVYVANIYDITTRAGHRVSDVMTMGTSLPGASPVWPPDDSADANAWINVLLRPYLDLAGYPVFSRSPNLQIRAATPDGRRLLVLTDAVTDGTARVFVVWGRPGATPEVRYVGVRDVSGPLQLSVRLPQRQGVVVATPNAALRYRIGAGPWVAVGDTWAALLPDTATAVEVTPLDGRPTRLPVR